MKRLVLSIIVLPDENFSLNVLLLYDSNPLSRISFSYT